MKSFKLDPDMFWELVEQLEQIRAISEEELLPNLLEAEICCNSDGVPTVKLHFGDL